jgi:bidirectional [NiFe] hydrogenase diaphorase subunit
MNAPSQVLTLKIDGQDVTGRADETILQLARENGIFIPTLCYQDSLTAIGACRMCLVEIKGSPKLVSACVTHIAEGMEVLTKSERLNRYRRMIVELLFSERNHICSVCVANGHCDLQTLARDTGVTYVDFPYRHPRLKVDASHERFGLDHNRCVLCTRCVRVCDEIEGAHVWDLGGRGIEACIVADLDLPWGESTTCTSCGKCVQICPTGALFKKGLAASESVKHRSFLTRLAAMREEEDER